MKEFNIAIFIAAVTISSFFLGSVFLNLKVKEKKSKIEMLKKNIKDINLSIKRYKIEISSLSSPKKVVSYIEENNLIPISNKDVTEILVNSNVIKSK